MVAWPSTQHTCAAFRPRAAGVLLEAQLHSRAAPIRRADVRGFFKDVVKRKQGAMLFPAVSRLLLHTDDLAGAAAVTASAGRRSGGGMQARKRPCRVEQGAVHLVCTAVLLVGGAVGAVAAREGRVQHQAAASGKVHGGRPPLSHLMAISLLP